MDKDFAAFPAKMKENARMDKNRRIEETLMVFPQVSFKKPRGLVNGAASHYLAARCYDYYSKEFSPTIKQGIACLRTAWLLDDIHIKYPDQHFDWLAVLFKKKAQFFYAEALRKEQGGKETLSGLKAFGPDTDKNYSYEGALYLTGLLRFRYGSQGSAEERKEALGEVKRTIARIFGLGKSSKSKPGPLLEHARNLYDNINKELNETEDAQP
jgi:uncharacterized protein (DUF2225 family)